MGASCDKSMLMVEIEGASSFPILRSKMHSFALPIV